MEEFWEIISPLREGGTRCLQRVAKIDAALPPDILGPIRLQCLRANGSMTQGQSSALAHKPATTGFWRM